MPHEEVTGRAGDGRASHAGTCVRAGLFAVLGTVLATFGHHAIAEGSVPWLLVTVSGVVQFALVWPLARQRYAAFRTVVFTLGTQGVLHLALSYTNGEAPTGIPVHAVHAGGLARRVCLGRRGTRAAARARLRRPAPVR